MYCNIILECSTQKLVRRDFKIDPVLKSDANFHSSLDLGGSNKLINTSNFFKKSFNQLSSLILCVTKIIKFNNKGTRGVIFIDPHYTCRVTCPIHNITFLSFV